MNKKPILWLLTLSLLLSLCPAALAATPAPKQVVVSPQSLTVDGVVRDAQKYNIDGSNYFKLRDLAYLLRGTESRFEVGWDEANRTVSIVTGKAYTPKGGELATAADRSDSAVPSAQTILVDGEKRDDLYVYNIGGENYFKLRDLGAALGFDVDYDTERNTAVVESRGYEAPAGEPKQEEQKQPETPAEPEPESEPEIKDEMKLSIGDKTYYLGMTEAELLALSGGYSDVVASTAGFNWMIFGTSDYTNFFIAGIDGGKVVALISGGYAFTYMGVGIGSTNLPAKNSYATLYTDKNDNGILHAVMLSNGLYSGGYSSDRFANDAALRGEAVVCFHMTNAFRSYHGMAPYRWSDAAAIAATLHSQDMADQDYFSHDSKDGRTFIDRMEAQGISWSHVAENCAAGDSLGVGAYGGWVNSAGHRKNLLGDCEYMGAGAGFNSGSSYRWYMTQDFYTEL